MHDTPSVIVLQTYCKPKRKYRDRKERQSEREREKKYVCHRVRLKVGSGKTRDKRETEEIGGEK